MAETPAADQLVVLDRLPHKREIPAAAAAIQGVLGGLAGDHARTLRACSGVLMERLDAASAAAVAQALTALELRAWALPMALVPRLPKPRVASRLDPGDPDALRAQVALTGPPEVIPWRQIVLVLPARLAVDTRSGRPAPAKKAKVGLGTVALAATTGLRARRVLSAAKERFSGRGAGGADPLSAAAGPELRELVELVAVAPHRRVQAYADRLDYSVLPGPLGPSHENFARLLQQVAARTRPGLASDGALKAFMERGELPAALHVEDNNGLRAVARWLLLRGAARRLQGRAGGG